MQLIQTFTREKFQGLEKEGKLNKQPGWLIGWKEKKQEAMWTFREGKEKNSEEGESKMLADLLPEYTYSAFTFLFCISFGHIFACMI